MQYSIEEKYIFDSIRTGNIYLYLYLKSKITFVELYLNLQQVDVTSNHSQQEGRSSCTSR